MKPHHMIAVGVLFALAACNQAPAPEEAAAPEQPASLLDQIQAQRAEDQMVTAFQALIAYQQANPTVQPTCASVRGTESRGIIPDDVAADSIYAAHKGSAVFSVQCGPQLTGTRFDPREHWLVAYAPGATEIAVVNCADARGQDQCPRTVPRAAAATP